jgi:hypothetical protein
MEHLDWLHPDHIILSNYRNSNVYQDFTKHMRSRKFQDLRLLKLEGVPGFNSNLYIRYKLDGKHIWYSAKILQKKGKDYYIEAGLLLSDIINELERIYIPLNREEKLNQLLK